MAKIVELIYTASTKGEGINGDPVRKVHEFWAKDGTLVAEIDNFNNSGNFFGLE